MKLSNERPKGVDWQISSAASDAEKQVKGVRTGMGIGKNGSQLCVRVLKINGKIVSYETLDVRGGIIS